MNTNKETQSTRILGRKIRPLFKRQKCIHDSHLFKLLDESMVFTFFTSDSWYLYLKNTNLKWLNTFTRSWRCCSMWQSISVSSCISFFFKINYRPYIAPHPGSAPSKCHITINISLLNVPLENMCVYIAFSVQSDSFFALIKTMPIK